MSEKIKKPTCNDKEKYCVRCETVKFKTEFNSHKGKKDGLNSYCKECNKIISKGYYNNNKSYHIKKINERTKKIIKENQRKIFSYFLENPCIDCGESNPIVLEFDHRDNVVKFKEISRMIGDGYSWKKIEEEIEKCDVRCANCHRIRTAEQFGWYKGLL